MDYTMACCLFQEQYYHGDIVLLVDNVTDGPHNGMLCVSWTVLPGRHNVTGGPCHWWHVTCFRDSITRETVPLVDHITDGPHSGMLHVSGTVLPWRHSVTGGLYNGMLPVSGTVLPGGRHCVTGGPHNGLLHVSGTVLPTRHCHWWTMSMMDYTMACYLFQGEYYQEDVVFTGWPCHWWTTQWHVTCFRDSITRET